MRTILLLAGALMIATPAAAAVATPDTAVATALPAVTTDAQLAQFIFREPSREDVTPGWPGERRRGWRSDRRRWNRDREEDGYTGQICRTRTVYQVNRFGQRVRRVIRSCD
jgi:hypothetical protein